VRIGWIVGCRHGGNYKTVPQLGRIVWKVKARTNRRANAMSA
jgi:hypothetical protein